MQIIQAQMFTSMHTYANMYMPASAPLEHRNLSKHLLGHNAFEIAQYFIQHTTQIDYV